MFLRCWDFFCLSINPQKTPKIEKIVVPGFLGDFEVKNMNYTSDFESIAREALRVLLVIFVASYKTPRGLCAVRPAH